MFWGVLTGLSGLYLSDVPGECLILGMFWGVLTGLSDCYPSDAPQDCLILGMFLGRADETERTLPV